MGKMKQIYDTYAVLLNYPGSGLYNDVQSCRQLLVDGYPHIAERLGSFAESIKEKTLSKMEELYIQTFDMNPASSLDTGWQLFGEEYNRGLFLVKLRQEMSRLDISESSELPDHLTHVLAMLGRMDEEAAEDFAVACVIPAIKKTLTALKQDNLYYPVIEGLVKLLVAQYGEEADVGPPVQTAMCPLSSIAREAHHG